MVAASSRKLVNCFCPITRVLPNQRRSGWIRVLGSSLLWNSCTETGTEAERGGG